MGYICRLDDELITGRQQGKEEGILLGRKEGILQGKEEGGNQKEKEMIKRLFDYCLGEGKNYEESCSYISKVYGYFDIKQRQQGIYTYSLFAKF